MRRVVVTGLGLVTPLADGVEESWSRILDGQSGAGPITGFDASNLRNMRRFYQAFPIWETLSLKLSWSHFNLLARIENPKARNWYMREASEQLWSVRALDRQISVLYYERLLSTNDKAAVELEAQEKNQKLSASENSAVDNALLEKSHKHYLRDPYILDFLNLSSQPLLENDIEQGIIDNLQKFLLLLIEENYYKKNNFVKLNIFNYNLTFGIT